MNNADLEYWDLLSELERKSMETCARLEDQYERGDISEHAYRTALMAIDGVSRGLIDNDISLALDEMATPLDKEARECHLLRNGNNVMALKRTLGDESFEVTVVKDPKDIRTQVVTSNDLDMVLGSYDKFKALVSKALTSGWE